MNRRFAVPAILIALLIAAGVTYTSARGCTGLTIRPKDGSTIFGRTLEFAVDFKSNCLIVPRGQEYVGTTPSGQPGLRWKSTHGVVGMNGFNLPILLDGLNDYGLSVGAFYFPSFAEYQPVTQTDVTRTLAPHEFPTYLLTTCGNVAEVVAATNAVRVAPVVFKEMGMVPPAHFIVSDAAGKCVVIEYVAGELKIHENRVGVITNSPTFDWHMTNLSNYVNLSVNNVPPLDFDGLALKGLGQGSGMLGLPGDFTPPSRFVRAAAFAQSALPVDTAAEGVLQLFHLLNQFDIPKGAARGMENGQEVSDYTLWTSVSDTANQRYYFTTFENRRIRMIDLRSVDFNAPQTLTISIREPEQIEDLSRAGR